MKKMIVPMLLLIITVGSAFASYQTRGKIIKTREGYYLIPSDVNMSAKDKKEFLSIAKEGGDEFGSLAFNDDNGLLQIQGNACLTEFREVGKIMKVNLEPTKVRSIAGFVIVDKDIDRNIVHTKTAWASDKAKVAFERLTPLIEKYSK